MTLKDRLSLSLEPVIETSSPSHGMISLFQLRMKSSKQEAQPVITSSPMPKIKNDKQIKEITEMNDQSNLTSPAKTLCLSKQKTHELTAVMSPLKARRVMSPKTVSRKPRLLFVKTNKNTTQSNQTSPIKPLRFAKQKTNISFNEANTRLSMIVNCKEMVLSDGGIPNDKD